MNSGAGLQIALCDQCHLWPKHVFQATEKAAGNGRNPRGIKTILTGVSGNGENGIADAMRQAGAAAPFFLDINMAWSHAESTP